MTTLSVVFLLLALLTCRWMLLKLRKLPFELHPAEPRADLRDVVSVIVPMRNEESHVDSCLSAIRAQSHLHLQVIVVDDASTDATPQILEPWKQRLPGLEVVRLESCPEGWAGKVHAMHRGQERARGEWLFFTDADVELAPDAIARSLATAVERDWSVLSVLGQLVTPSFWEQAVQLRFSALFVSVMAEAPRATLCGQYILMRRSLYDQVGGYAAIADAVAEDREMARLLRAHGVKFRTCLWTEGYRTRMFTSGRGIWRGIRRIIAGTARFSASNILGVAMLLGFLDLLPFAALAYATASYPQGGRRVLFWMFSAAALILTRWIQYQRLLARLHAPAGAFLLKPLGDLLSFLIYLDAALCSRTGSVSWKDRAYSRGSQARPPQTAVPAPGPAPAPREKPPLPPGEYRMSVVVEMNNSEYWHGEGVECDRSIAQYFRMAEEYPGVEIVFVTDRPILWSKPQPRNLRFLDAPSGDYYAMKRHGMLHARSDLIAFVDSDCIYPRNYVPRLLEAFEDSKVQIVGARVRYPPTSARLKAGSVRDWGHLPDEGTTLCHFAGSAFAARRQILERHDFGLGFQRVGAEVVLYVLARMDGVGIRYLPDLTVFHENYYRSLRTVCPWMFRRLAMAAEALRLYLQVRGPLALSQRTLLRLLPLMTAAHISWTCAQRYPLMKAGLAVRGLERLTVPLWLAAYGALGFVIALRMVLQPGWSKRTGIEERSAFSPEVYENPHHPGSLALDRAMTWILEDPRWRLRLLFVPERVPEPNRAAAGPRPAWPSAEAER